MSLTLSAIKSVTLKQAALQYAKNKIPVFPCKPNTKRPLTPNGFKDASINIVKIKAWWEKNPNAWIGIPTGELSGLTVLDLDVKKGNDGISEIEKLEKKHGELPATLVVETPTGGLHYWFKYAPGIKSSASKIAKGVDIRGEGGYIIAPPSPGYASCNDRTIGRVPALPEAFITLASEKVVSIESNPGFKSRAGMIPEGQRLEYLKQQAGKLHAAGIQPEAIYTALLTIVETECEKGSEPIAERDIENLAFKEAWTKPSDFKVTEQEGEFKIKEKNLKSLYRRRFKPPVWCVERMIPEGLTMLAGRPKQGKSRLAWSLAHAVATGSPFLGKFSTTQGKILYLSLEDISERMLKDRAKKMGLSGTNSFTYEVEAPRMDDNLAGYLYQRKELYPDTSLVVVDTITKIKPDVSVMGKRQDYDIEAEIWGVLHDVAHQLKIAVLGIYHTKKSQSEEFIDDIMGSTGITATFDTIAVLRADRKGGNKSVMSVKGREVEEQKFALSFNLEFAKWEYLNETVRSKIDEYTLQIWDAIKQHGEPINVKQLSESIGKSIPTVRAKLRAMVKSGEVEKISTGGADLYHLSVM